MAHVIIIGEPFDPVAPPLDLETQASTESNYHGTNILVVKGTAHARMKEIRTKATVIAVANFDVGHLRKIS